MAGDGDGGVVALAGGAVRRMDPAALPSGVVGGVVEDRGTGLVTNRGVFRMPRSEMDAAFDGRTDGLGSDL